MVEDRDGEISTDSFLYLPKDDLGGRKVRGSEDTDFISLIVLLYLGPQLFLGMYPEEHFIEKPVKEAMVRFRKNLDTIVSVIAERNKNKKLPYYYLSPDRIPNSVAI